MEVLDRVGVIGDVHACDARLATLLADLERRALDAIWCVGDVVTGPGDPDRCVALLQAAGAVTVRGNHDRWCVEGTMGGLPGAHRLDGLDPATQTFLRTLPATFEAAAPDGTPVLLCHGLGPDDMNKVSADDFGLDLEVNDRLTALRAAGRRIVVKGHRHRPSVWRLSPLTLIDAGTLLDAGSDRCGAVLDLVAMTATPLALADGVVRVEPAVGLAA